MTKTKNKLRRYNYLNLNILSNHKLFHSNKYDKTCKHLELLIPYFSFKFFLKDLIAKEK